MAIHIGSTSGNVRSMHFGAGNISAVYRGADKIWPNYAEDVGDVAMQNDDGFYLRNDGKVFCHHNGGALTKEYALDRSKWYPVPELSGIKRLYCNGYWLSQNNDIIVAVDANGTAYAKGIGNTYAFPEAGTTSFTKVTGIDNIRQLIVTKDNSWVLKNDGTLWTRGNLVYSNSSALGLGEGVTAANWTRITTNAGNIKHIFRNWSAGFGVVKNDGSVWITGSPRLEPRSTHVLTRVTTLTGVSKVAQYNQGNGYPFLALLSNGDVYGAGNNGNGELGTGNTLEYNTPVKLSVSGAVDIWNGDGSSFIKVANGDVYAAGWNYYGGLGYGPTANTTSTLTTFTVIPELKNVKELSVGRIGLALFPDETIKMGKSYLTDYGDILPRNNRIYHRV